MVVLGYVKWFSTMRGYGFIQSDSVPGDIFFHITHLQMIGGLSVAPGDKVICKIHLNDKKVYKAEQFFYFKNMQHNILHLDEEIEKIIMNNTIEIFKKGRIETD